MQNSPPAAGRFPANKKSPPYTQVYEGRMNAVPPSLSVGASLERLESLTGMKRKNLFPKVGNLSGSQCASFGISGFFGWKATFHQPPSERLTPHASSNRASFSERSRIDVLLFLYAPLSFSNLTCTAVFCQDFNLRSSRWNRRQTGAAPRHPAGCNDDPPKT